MRSHELVKRLDFFSGQVNWMSGLGTTHWFHLPLSVYLVSLLLSKAERTYDSLYLGKSSRLALHRYIRQYRTHARPTDTVFQSRTYRQMTINGLDQILYRLRDWAHLDVPAGAHKFRHTFSVNYLLAGGDVYKLSRLLGHTNVTTTERYVRSMSQRDARQGLSVLDQLRK